jgi:hypothetical protein
MFLNLTLNSETLKLDVNFTKFLRRTLVLLYLQTVGIWYRNLLELVAF